MIQAGECYKYYTGEIYYIICEALMCYGNNTQDRFIVYKQIDKDQVYIRSINEFEEFIETEDGEKLRRFKKIENNIPTILNPSTPYTPYIFPYPYIATPINISD